jgi:hypothetical protein
MERVTEVLWLLGDVRRDLENLEEELRKDGRGILSREPADIGRKVEQALGMLKRMPKRSTLGTIHQTRSKYF